MTFPKNYSEVSAYLMDGASRHGGKRNFLSSTEYREAHKRIVCLYTIDQDKEKKSQLEYISGRGLVIGCRVAYTTLCSFMQVATAGGVIVLRGGYVRVLVDVGDRVLFCGRAYVRIHDGWCS